MVQCEYQFWDIPLCLTFVVGPIFIYHKEVSDVDVDTVGKELLGQCERTRHLNSVYDPVQDYHIAISREILVFDSKINER